MIKQVLQEIGLTNGECRVYLSLLKLGNCTSGLIIKNSNISRSKVYEILNKLQEKGLITQIIENKVRHFQATHPNKIMDYVEEKKNKLNEIEKNARKIIPDLLKIRTEIKNKQEAKLYSGFEGWKTLYSEMLSNMNKKDEYLAFGVGMKELSDKRVERFFKTFHMKRAEKQIPARIIVHSNTKNVIKGFPKSKYTNFKYLNTKFPTNINIHKNNVVTLVWSENPTAYLIEDKEVAKKYKDYFEILWKQSNNKV